MRRTKELVGSKNIFPNQKKRIKTRYIIVSTQMIALDNWKCLKRKPLPQMWGA